MTDRDSLDRQSDRRPYLLEPGQGVPGFGPAVKAAGASTGGVIALIESDTTGGAPMHVHSRDDECFYVLEGNIRVECGDETFRAGPRSFIFLPHGIAHSWDVEGGGRATVLMITVPSGLEVFLRDYHAASSQDEKDAIAAKHGISWVR